MLRWDEDSGQDAVGAFQDAGGGGKEFPADVGDAPHQYQPDDAHREGDDQHCRRPDQRGHDDVPCAAGGGEVTFHPCFLLLSADPLLKKSFEKEKRKR